MSLSATNTEKKNTQTAAADAASRNRSSSSSSSSTSNNSRSKSDPKVPEMSSSSSSSSSSLSQAAAANTLATEIEDRFLALEVATRQCLLEKQQQQHNSDSSSSTNSIRQCQDLLQQWHALLPDLEYYCNNYNNQHAHAFEKKDKDMIVQAVERMEDLFSELVVPPPSSSATATNDNDNDVSRSESSALSWFLSTTTTPTSITTASRTPSRRNYPHHSNKTTYQIMLQAVSRYHPTGSTALRILQAWNEALQGDLEQAPTKEDYHTVLQAYVNQYYLHSTNRKTKTLFLDDPLVIDMTTGADVAREIVQYLQQAWNTSMRPDIITHALALQCMVRPLTVLSTIEASNAAAAATTTAVEQKVETDPVQEAVSSLRENFESSKNEFLKQLKVWMVPSALSGVFEKPKAVASRTSKALKEKQEQVVCILGALDAVMQQNPTTTITTTTDDAEEKGLFEWVQLWKEIITMQNLDASDRQVEQVLSHSSTTILKHCLNEASAVKKSSSEALALCQLIDTTLETLERFQQPYLPFDHHYYFAINARKSLVKVARDDERIRKWIDKIESIRNAFQLSPHDILNRKTDSHEIAKSFSNLMKIYYEGGQDDLVEQVWNGMVEKKEIVPISTFSVSFILKSLARHQQSPLRAAEKAQAILENILAMDPSDPNYFKPTAQHYASAMVAWRHTEIPLARSKCRDLMDRLIKDSKDNPEMQPKEVHYAALIGSHGWTDPGKNDPHVISEEEQNSLFKAIDEAFSCLQIDLRLCKAMLVALSRMRSTDADVRALKLLDEIIVAFKKDGRDDLKPTSDFISAIMYFWSRSGSPRAAEQCESLLRRLEALYEKSGGDLWLRPSADCYKSLVHAYINLGVPDSATLAEQVLDRMESAALDGKADSPNKMIYAAIITAYTKSELPDAARKAESVLTRMAKSYMFGNSDARPDGRMCSALLFSWARSNLPDKAFRSKALLDRMRLNFQKGDKNMKPEAAAFVSVLNACAHTNTQEENVRSKLVLIALATLDDMVSILGKSNETAFKQILLVIRRHVSDAMEREQLTRALFRRCCKEGFVTSPFLREIRHMCPSLETNRDEMPPSWTRNIKSS